jgi:hypothetical protein
VTSTLHKYNYDYQVEENEVARACRANGGEEDHA